MKFKKQRDEEERLERVTKIEAHLKKTQPAAAKAEPTTEPKAAQPLLVPPLQPWERLNRWGRREQWRPLTSRELDQENDRLFMESQKRQDLAHAKKVAAFEQEQAADEKAAKKQREHEARTGRRPYEAGRYISLKEARRRGYLDNVDSEDNGWASPGNPDGVLGGGR